MTEVIRGVTTSRHAIERWRERVHNDEGKLRDALEAMREAVADGEHVDEPPYWSPSEHRGVPTHGYLVYDRTVFLPMVGQKIKTVIPKDSAFTYDRLQLLHRRLYGRWNHR